MPVRYDIAAGVPQAQGGGFDPMNAFATMQAMSYRQQQNALAEMQMAQAQREAQQEAATAGLFARPGFNPLTRQGLMEIARTNPAYFRQYITPFAGFEAETMRGKSIGQDIAQKSRLFPSALSKAEAEAGEAKGKRVVSESKAAQEILRDVYLAHSPERPGAFEDAYAGAYGQLKDVAPNIAKRLGPRPDISAIERAITSGEEFAAARKPISGMKTEDVLVTPTGRPGEPPIAVQPQYRAPNAMATNQPALNTFAQQGRMPPSADMTAPEVDPIIATALRKDAMLKQLPPGPVRETAGARMDLRDTFDSMEASFGALADAGGIPRAGATNATNWKAAFKKSPTGQAIGGLTDSETNAQLAALRTQSAILKAQLRKGLEMGITQMDAVKEADKLDAAFLNPDKTKGLGEAYASIDALRKLMGGGETVKPATRGKAGEEPKLKPLEGTIDLDQMRD